MWEWVVQYRTICELIINGLFLSFSISFARDYVSPVMNSCAAETLQSARVGMVKTAGIVVRSVSHGSSPVNCPIEGLGACL